MPILAEMPDLPAFALEAGEGERLTFGGVTIVVRTPSEASGGAFTLFEEVPPMADTPAHVHANEDELFYVLEGEHVFTVGDEELPAQARAGSSSLRAEFRTRSVVSSREKGGSWFSRHPEASKGSSGSWRPRRRPERSGLKRTPLHRRRTGSPGSGEDGASRARTGDLRRCQRTRSPS